MAPSTFVRRWGNCFSRFFTSSSVSFRAVTPSTGPVSYTHLATRLFLSLMELDGAGVQLELSLALYQ